MDFTCSTHHQLLESLISAGYKFITFENYITHQERPERFVILRHDVEARYKNALDLAIIQHNLNIKGSYYFRFLPAHFDTEIIRKIAVLGHEIGYHYEDLSYCHGNYEKALERFAKNLAILREIAPVKTICMEGAPLSKWDNRDLWRKEKSAVGSRQSIVKGQNPEPGTWNHQDNKSSHPSPLTAHYNDFGIIGEPYFDIDFNNVFYLTDTGRRWDGEKVSVRDKVGSRQSAVGSRQSAVNDKNSKITPNSITPTQNSKLNNSNSRLRFHSTFDIITAANNRRLPDQIMFTFHPQRWTVKPLPWMKELVMQNVKNVVKRVVLSLKS